MAYQWDVLAKGAEIECALDNDMPTYFAQVSFSISMR